MHISKGHSLILLQIVHNDKSQLQSEVSKASLTGFYMFYLFVSMCTQELNTGVHIYKETVIHQASTYFIQEKAIPEVEMQYVL